MRRAAAGWTFFVMLAWALLWTSPGRGEPADAAPVTWGKDLDAAVERAAKRGKVLAILFR